MKVITLCVHRNARTLLHIAAIFGIFASVPLYSYEIPDEYAESHKLTPEQRKDLNAALYLDEPADEQAKAADYYARQGDVQAAAGKYARALELSREALKGWERVLGPECREALEGRHYIGLLLIRVQKFEEAVAEFHTILAIKQRVSGMKSNDTWRA